MNNIVQKITSDSQEVKETAHGFNKSDEDTEMHRNHARDYGRMVL
jgi:hypothetical protein